MNMVSAQFNAFLLCAPTFSTLGFTNGRTFLNGQRKTSRTFIGPTEPLDAVYRPAFPIDSRYEGYFQPTMLTDEEGNLVEELHQDLRQDCNKKSKISNLQAAL